MCGRRRFLWFIPWTASELIKPNHKMPLPLLLWLSLLIRRTERNVLAARIFPGNQFVRSESVGGKTVDRADVQFGESSGDKMHIIGNLQNVEMACGWRGEEEFHIQSIRSTNELDEERRTIESAYGNRGGVRAAQFQGI